MVLEKMPYRCLECEGRPGSSDFDCQFCISCLLAQIDCSKSMLKALSSSDLFEGENKICVSLSK